MKATQIKTIDVNCKEWFDKVNGNSYFAGTIVINYGRKNEIEINLPFQYGYGDHYKDIAYKVIKKQLNCFKKVDVLSSYWRAYNQYKIKATHNKKDNCLKRELMAY